MRLLPLALAGFLSTAATPQPPPVTLNVWHLTSPYFEVVLEPTPKLNFQCKLVPQGPGAGVLKTCKAVIAKGTLIKLKAHRHYLKKLPSGKVDVPITNSEWTNACAMTKGDTCVLPMQADTTAEMKFKLVN